MNTETKTHEVDMKNMLFFVLYQWKKMLVWAVIFAIALGCIKGYTSWKTATDPDLAAQYEQEYNTAMADYESQKAELEKSVADDQENVDKQREYVEKSVLMQMDYRNFYEAKLTLYVSTNYQIMPGMEYQNPDNSKLILASYESALTNDRILTEVAEAVGMEQKYLKELVTVTTSLDHMLHLTVRNTDKVGAEEILRLIQSRIGQVQEQLTESIGDHELKTVLDTAGILMDTKLADKQEEERVRLQNYETDLRTHTDALNALQAPQKTVVSTEGAVKDGITFIFVGLGIGIVVVTLISCMVFALGGKVYSGGELRERYGINILGGIAPDKKTSKLDAWLKRKEDRVTENTDAVYDLICTNVRNYSSGAKKILVAGDAAQTEVAGIAGKLQERMQDIRFVSCGHLLRDAQAACAMTECDGVLLVEKCKASRYARVELELERVRDTKKPLIGCIVIER